MNDFFSNMYTGFVQISILAIIVVIGFICDKIGLYTQTTAKLTNGLLFYIITPAVVIRSFCNIQFTPQNGKTFLIALLFGVLLQVVGIFLALPFFNKNQNGCIFKYASIYGNVGYMGLPLSQAILGDEGVFICSVFISTFNLFAFTHGVVLMTRDQEKTAGRINLKKIFINPGTIGILIGMPIFLLGIPLNSAKIIYEPISMMAELNTPVAMLLFGTYIANTDLKTTFKQKESYLVVLIKLVALPALMVALGKIFNLDRSLLVATAILAGAPTANNTVMFAAQFGKDTGLASKLSALCSIISIVTLPVWIAIAEALI